MKKFLVKMKNGDMRVVPGRSVSDVSSKNDMSDVESIEPFSGGKDVTKDEYRFSRHQYVMKRHIFGDCL